MTIYSTLVGWLNSQDDKFGEEFVKYALEQLNEMLLSSRWEAARYTVRFISGKLILTCGVLLGCEDSLLLSKPTA